MVGSFLNSSKSQSQSDGPCFSQIGLDGEMVWDGNIATFLGVDIEHLEMLASPRQFEALCVLPDDGKRLSFLEKMLSSAQREGKTNFSYDLTYQINPFHNRRKTLRQLWETGKATLGIDGTWRIKAELRWLPALPTLSVAQKSADHFHIKSLEMDRSNFIDLIERTLYLANVGRKRQKAPRPGQFEFALFTFAVDRLDQIAEVYGYSVANEALSHLVSQLRSCLRQDDVLGRLSTNMIGILVPGSTEDDLQLIAERLILAMCPEAVPTSAGQLITTISMGAVSLGAQTPTLNEVMTCAEEALRMAKTHKRSSISIYSDHESRSSKRAQNLQSANQITSALNEKRLHIAFQPVVKADSAEVMFEEAFIRAEDENGAALMPGTFTSVVQKLGLARLVDLRALELVLERLETHSNAVIAVNLAPESLNDPQWLQRISAVAVSNRGLLSRLIVQITNASTLDLDQDLLDFVDFLHNLGVRVAIDDFGSGHMPFAYLKTLKLDLLKLDGAYGVGLARDASNQSFVKCMSELAHSLNMEVVLGWVGAAEDASCAQSLGVDFLQGALYGIATDLPEHPKKIYQEEAGGSTRRTHLSVIK